MSKLTKALTAAAGNAGGDPLYAEDVFSTYLYTGTGSAMTITNGVNLEDNGGIVWTKPRTASGESHRLIDADNSTILTSDGTNAKLNGSLSVPQYYLQNNTDGFDLVGNISVVSGADYASWTFRKAEKFFDVQTYTGNGTAGRTVAHNLGSVPAVMIVKSTTNGAYGWRVYHQSLGNTDYLRLNETNAAAATAGMWNNTTPTDSEFTLGGASVTNGNGESFVAYLFASDAGGFGDDGSENVIKCGSFTGNATVDVGFEPQWVMVKRTDNIGNWFMQDNMRGIPTGGIDATLFANLSNAENSNSDRIDLTATGFSAKYGTGSETYIYIAIRRPMKTPESGTEVFSPNATTTFPATMTTGFPVDLTMTRTRTALNYFFTGDRLRGNTKYLTTATTNAEATFGAGNEWLLDSNTTITQQNSTGSVINYNFKRATGFMDVVAYSGTGSATTQAHNLGVVPELMIVKRRNAAINWHVYSADVGNTSTMYLDLANAPDASVGYWNNTTPTSSVFTVGTTNGVNASGSTYIAYLFATLAGVSKVGSYTGTGSNVNVDCGFSAGARWIMIKRTDSTGDWYVWDSVRGISAGNDPYLLLNSTAAEVTNTDYVDPLSSGFTVTSSAPAALNASGGNYIFLAIA